MLSHTVTQPPSTPTAVSSVHRLLLTHKPRCCRVGAYAQARKSVTAADVKKFEKFQASMKAR